MPSPTRGCLASPYGHPARLQCLLQRCPVSLLRATATLGAAGASGSSSRPHRAAKSCPEQLTAALSSSRRWSVAGQCPVMFLVGVYQRSSKGFFDER